MSNIHDNEIISYNVDLKNHKIIIQTLPYQGLTSIEIVFSDVLAHLFETQLEGSIILGIKKYDLSNFVEDNRDLLEKQKKYSWPLEYNTPEELTDKLIKELYAYYVVFSSYGLNGWVLAKRYEIKNNE